MPAFPPSLVFESQVRAKYVSCFLQLCFQVSLLLFQCESNLMRQWTQRLRVRLLHENDFECRVQRITSEQRVHFSVDSMISQQGARLESALSCVTGHLQSLWSLVLDGGSSASGDDVVPKDCCKPCLDVIAEVSSQLHASHAAERVTVEKELSMNVDSSQSDIRAALAQLDASATKLMNESSARLQSLGITFAMEWMSSASRVRACVAFHHRFSLMSPRLHRLC